MDLQIVFIVQVTIFSLVLLLLVGAFQYLLHRIHFPNIFLGLYAVGALYCLLTKNMSLFIIITLCFVFSYIGALIGRYIRAINKRIGEEFDKVSKEK